MSASPIVIAHRGASAYLPEHTLEAKALAYGMGADFLEQDVVATRDDQLVVLHDIHLDRVTDVAERFPERAREDGRWYVRDFDLAELRELRVRERSHDAGGHLPVFPGRYPARRGHFAVASLDDELEMVRCLNGACGRNVGIYPEIKRPAWHHAEGVDCASLLLDALDRHGFKDSGAPVYVQCFDPAELRRLRNELAAPYPLIQLIADDSWGEADTTFAEMLTPAGLGDIADYAAGIGPWLRQLYTFEPISGEHVSTGIVKTAQELGLMVHPYTFRADALEPGFDDFEQMLRWFVSALGIDGLFTDFPDRARQEIGRLWR